MINHLCFTCIFSNIFEMKVVISFTLLSNGPNPLWRVQIIKSLPFQQRFIPVQLISAYILDSIICKQFYSENHFHIYIFLYFAYYYASFPHSLSIPSIDSVLASFFFFINSLFFLILSNMKLTFFIFYYESPPPTKAYINFIRTHTIHTQGD